MSAIDELEKAACHAGGSGPFVWLFKAIAVVERLQADLLMIREQQKEDYDIARRLEQENNVTWKNWVAAEQQVATLTAALEKARETLEYISSFTDPILYEPVTTVQFDMRRSAREALAALGEPPKA